MVEAMASTEESYVNGGTFEERFLQSYTGAEDMAVLQRNVVDLRSELRNFRRNQNLTNAGAKVAPVVYQWRRVWWSESSVAGFLLLS